MAKGWIRRSVYIFVGLVLVVQLFPIFVAGVTSFKTPISMMNDYGIFTLDGIWFGNYVRVLADDGFLEPLWTSTRIALASTLLSLIAGSLAAHALVQFSFPGRRWMTASILVSRMIPPVALALPVFLLLRQFNLVDSISGLVVAHTTFNLPFAVWLLLPFFAGLPKDYGEAAQVDGATSWQAFRLIYLPLALPGLVVAGIFCFLLSWNDFLFSLILAGSSTTTAPLAVNAYMTADQIEWGPMTASSMIIMIPVFLFSLLLQRRLVGGLGAGGVKG